MFSCIGEGLYECFTASGTDCLFWKYFPNLGTVFGAVGRLCAHMGQLSGYWQLGAGVENVCVQAAKRGLQN